MISILIADDHPVVRRGLKEILKEEKDLKIVDEASSAPEVFNVLRQKKIDIILLDISMPGRSGLDIIPDILNEFPSLLILAISALQEETFAKRVIKAGAHGYLNKESAPEQLIQAIRRIYSGKRYISEKFSEQLAESFVKGKKNKPHDDLSDREFEVLRYLGSGKTINEIAGILKLSATTISTYRARILSKTGLKNNSDLVKYCLNENISLLG
ncbi:MAG: response regulator transcription factor [Ignavibacteriaceae bacterium]|nr:response regulator transcription factor [Ignavibacteriaceae bacterium]